LGGGRGKAAAARSLVAGRAAKQGGGAASQESQQSKKQAASCLKLKEPAPRKAGLAALPLLSCWGSSLAFSAGGSSSVAGWLAGLLPLSHEKHEDGSSLRGT